MVEAVRLVLTLTGVLGPDVLIMRAMGWTSLAHFALAAGWVAVSTGLIILTPQRHRRREWPKSVALATVIAWVALGVMVLGTNWDLRIVIAVLLVLPGLNYLWLEAIGLTPKPRTSGPSLP